MHTLNEALDKSIQILREGWAQGAYEDLDENGNPTYCAVGAIRKAVYGSMSLFIDDIDGDITEQANDNWNLYMQTYHCVEDAAKKHLNDRGGIMYFNDTVAKSVDDVIAIFEEAKVACG